MNAQNGNLISTADLDRAAWQAVVLVPEDQLESLIKFKKAAGSKIQVAVNEVKDEQGVLETLKIEHFRHHPGSWSQVATHFTKQCPGWTEQLMSTIPSLNNRNEVAKLARVSKVRIDFPVSKF
jgi:hypothetical protein